MNIVVLRGVLARRPVERALPSGDTVLHCELTVPAADHPTETVPVVWPDHPAAAARLDAGSDVVVVGRVRRRFFTAGGSTQSRTEVVSAVVLPAGQRRRVERALTAVIAGLSDPPDRRAGRV